MGKRFYNRISRIFNCKHSGGLIDKLINTLPLEAHMPGYNFCGPGTKLQKRLERGDQGINPLDEACTATLIVITNKARICYIKMYCVYSERQTDCVKARLQELHINICRLTK